MSAPSTHGSRRSRSLSFPVHGDIPGGYEDDLNLALHASRDLWGELALHAPDGPGRGSVDAPLLPLVLGDRDYLTETGFPYVVFTDAVGSDTFSLHVTDGSQVYAEYTPKWGAPDWGVPFPRPEREGDAAPHVTFHLDDEVYGSDPDRLELPVLAEGWLPILQVAYRDADGGRWVRESFAGSERIGGTLATWVRFDRAGASPARPLAIEVLHEERDRMTLDDRGVLRLDGRAFAWGPSGAHWDGRRLTYDVAGELVICILNQPADAESPGNDLAAGYADARRTTRDYWRTVRGGGTRVSVPDVDAQHALDNLLLQNLVMQERYSIGNPYEFVFTMEGHASVESLLAYGFFEEARGAYQRLVGITNGPAPEWYESWERGVKLSSAARYTRLADDPTLLEDNLDVYESYREDFDRQMGEDPHGLLAQERYAWDIPTYIYGWHSEAVAWRGMLDVAEALRGHGHDARAARWAASAERLRAALLVAIDKSAVWLDDGSYFVPVSLLSDETPHESLTESRLASYWNIVGPYALATGIIPPDTPEGKGLLRYMELHGAWFLGLTRFNGLYDPPTPIGEVRADGTGGYKTTGIDNAWGVQGARYLAMSRDGDRVALTVLSKLVHGMTPGTFLDGEATTLGYAPDDLYRSTWYSPNSTSNALYLLSLRDALVHLEQGPAGRARLHVGMGLPREWLAPGLGVSVAGLPTALGPVTMSLSPDPGGSRLRVQVDCPGLDGDVDLVVHLRLPGRPEIDLPAHSGARIHGEELLVAGATEPVAIDVRLTR